MTDREKLIELIVTTPVPCMVVAGVRGGKSLISASVIADHLLANGVIVPPCKEGETVYKIKKFCEKSEGYQEFYVPSKQFALDCRFYEPSDWGIEERCAACDDVEDRYYCSLDVGVFCKECKERFAIQKDIFNFSMMRRVFNSPMYDKNTQLRDTLFLTQAEAEKALEDWISHAESPKEGR